MVPATEFRFKVLFKSSGPIHVLNFPGFLTATKEDIQSVGSLISIAINVIL